MKPGIPETGTILRLEGEHAVVRMKSESSSCGKCGVAAAGLCHGGLMKVLTVRNPQRARVGDTVRIGLVQGIKYRGYFLAYVVPVAALVLGAVAGTVFGAAAGLRGMDVLAGFTSLIAALVFSAMRLRRLNSSASIEIVDVLCDPGDPVR